MEKQEETVQPDPEMEAVIEKIHELLQRCDDLESIVDPPETTKLTLVQGGKE